MDHQAYLKKKYMDTTQTKQKTIYKPAIKDQDNIDILMGKVIDKDEYYQFDQQPIFVETKESMLIDKNKKNLFLQQMLNKERSRSNSQSSQNNKSDQSDSDESESEDSDSDLSVQRAPQQVVHRDMITGQRITQQERIQQEKQLNEKIKTKTDKETVIEANKRRIEIWSKGLKQQQEKQQKEQEAQQVQSLNREDQVKQIDIQLIGQQKFDDPMRKMIQDEDDKQLVYKGDFMLKCKFPPIPNRFNIKPGFRWDGVDRSNGYEVKFLNSINERKFMDLEEKLENMRDQ